MPTKVVVSGTGKMGRQVLAPVCAEPDLKPVAVLSRLAAEECLPLPDGSDLVPFGADPAGLFTRTRPDVVVDLTNADHTPSVAREALEAAGIATREPLAVAADPALPEACAYVAAIARQRYEEADDLLAAMASGDRKSLAPAVVMMMVYKRLLDRLVAGGWRRPERRVKLPRWEKMWIALRHGVL